MNKIKYLAHLLFTREMRLNQCTCLDRPLDISKYQRVRVHWNYLILITKVNIQLSIQDLHLSDLLVLFCFVFSLFIYLFIYLFVFCFVWLLFLLLFWFWFCFCFCCCCCCFCFVLCFVFFVCLFVCLCLFCFVLFFCGSGLWTAKYWKYFLHIIKSKF